MTAENAHPTTPIATTDGEIDDAGLAKVTGGGGKTKPTPTPVLTIDGIKGESLDDKHPSTIEI
jgi:hypothetical protein